MGLNHTGHFYMDFFFHSSTWSQLCRAETCWSKVTEEVDLLGGQRPVGLAATRLGYPLALFRLCAPPRDHPVIWHLPWDTWSHRGLPYTVRRVPTGVCLSLWVWLAHFIPEKIPSGPQTEFQNLPSWVLGWWPGPHWVVPSPSTQQASWL